MTLYLLGGAARSGKSAIARQFLIETGTPYFCLDYLIMGFANGLPEVGVDPEDDELKIADLLWPVVKPLAVALVEDEVEYLLEGVQLRPWHVAELCRELPGHVRACFIGFATVDTLQKSHQLRRFGGGLDDWLRDYDDQRIIQEVERMKALSQRVRTECNQCGLTYFEVDTDLQKTVATVVEYLRG